MLRKIYLIGAAVTTAVLLGGSSCSSERPDNGCLPGIISEACPELKSPEPTPKDKPLKEILIESGWSVKEFELEEPFENSATIELPGVSCAIYVTLGKNDTYWISRIGGSLEVDDLPGEVHKALNGKNPKADAVEKALRAAEENGTLRC